MARGGLCGTMINGILSRISIDGGSVLGVGGICGTGSGLIEECYSNCEVTNSGTSYVGGICGSADTITINNCYVVGNVISNAGYYTGSLLGGNWNATILNNCYSIGCTSAPIMAYAHPLGWAKEGNNAYWCKAISKTTIDTEGEVTYENLFKRATYENWDFENIWEIQEGQTTPYLKWMGAPPQEVTKEYLDAKIENNN